MVRGVPVYGSRRRGLFLRTTRRLATVLLVGAVAAGAFLLSHISRAPSTHQADDQEERCRLIEESEDEEYAGELAECQQKLARLRVIEHATPPSTLDSIRQSP
jgi:hypothetical protein